MSITKSGMENPFDNRVGLVYARVSTKRQETEGNGLESQEGRCISELKLLNVPFEKTFPDSFTGGGDFMNRPAMRALLNHIDKNRHKKFVVIFDDLKRFARDVEFHLKLRATFKARGVILKCLNYNFEDTPEGRFVEVIMAGASELEREQNKRQVIQKMRARLEAGYWPFGGKRGYTIEKHNAHGKLAVPHKVDGRLLKEAFEGFASGTFIRPVDACKFLMDNNFWSRPPEKNTEKFIGFLKDPFYAGYIEYPSWGVERRLGKHEPLISLQTFQRNQDRLNLRHTTKKIRIDSSEDFPFRGLINCAECKGHFTGTWGNGRKGVKYAYYFCQNRNCVAFRRTVRRKDIEDSFRELITNRTLTKKGFNLLEKAFDESWNEETNDFNSAQKNFEKAQDEMNQKVSNLTTLLIQAPSQTLRKVYENEIEKCAVEIERLQQNTLSIDMEIPYRTALDMAATFLKSPYWYWLKVDVVEKQRLFFFLFDSELVYSLNEGYRTENNPIATMLFENFLSSKTLDVEMGSSELPCRR